MSSHEMGTRRSPVGCVTCPQGSGLVPKFAPVWILEAAESKRHTRENPVFLNGF